MQQTNDLITILNPRHEGKLVYAQGGSEEYEVIDGERHCLHINAEIERACCSGFEGGLPSCACHGQDSIGCPNPLCDGMTEVEVDAMLTPEEPDYEPEYQD